MLNYSWKASPNRWGRPEFNASFSIGFGNGFAAANGGTVTNGAVVPFLKLPNPIGGGGGGSVYGGGGGGGGHWPV